MKIAPSNQTLILAGEGSAGKSAVAPRQNADSPANAPLLQRVTVVTALPDSTTVYVHADYATDGTAASGRVVATQARGNIQAALTPTAAADNTETAHTDSSDASDSAETAASNRGTLVQLSSPEYANLLRSSDGSRDPNGNPHSLNQNVNLYAQTQLITGARATSLVDVHA